MADMQLLLVLLSLQIVVCFTAPTEEGYFWHITDIHYDPTYGSDMRSCVDEVPAPGVFGDGWCDSPWHLINDSIVSMGRIKKDVDFILWTGDSIPHIDDDYMSEDYILSIMQNVTDALKVGFPHTQVYATMGNNDWYLSDQFTPTPHRIYNQTADMWKEWIGHSEQVDNFRKGAYYTLKTRYGLRIVALNTNVYYFRDKLTANVVDPVGQFAWMERVLDNAKKAGEKVLFTGHIPPGVHAPAQLQWYYDRFNTRFMDISRTYADVIVGMFCGHDHGDVLKLLKTIKGSPAVPIYIAPCLTPWRYKIPGETGLPHNPGIRLVKYNRTSSLPLDIHQYYMNFTESNKNNASNWTLAYTTSQTYGMSDLSARSLNSVLKRMETDRPALDKYIRYNTVLANGETTVKSCGATCRARIVCSFTYFEKKSFESCVESHVSPATRGCISFWFIASMLNIAVAFAF